MGKKLVRETVDVKINWTEKEKMQVILQGSISVMATLYQRLNNSIQLYEREGYKITVKDSKKMSFVAEKEDEIEDEKE